MCSLTKIKDSIALVDKLPLGVVITDFEGNVIYCNNKFTKLNGYSLDDIKGKKIGKHYNILYSGYHTDEFYANLWNTLKSGQTFEGKIKNKKKNGDTLWQKVAIVPFRNDELPDNPIENFIAFITDITSFMYNEDFLQKILQTSPSLIYVYDLVEEKLLFVNDEGLKILGYTVDDTIDLNKSSLEKYLSKESLETYEERNKKVKNLKNGDKLFTELVLLDKKGNKVYFNGFEAIFQRDESGKPIKKIGSLLNVTKQKVQEQNLQTLSSVLDNLIAKQEEINTELAKTSGLFHNGQN